MQILTKNGKRFFMGAFLAGLLSVTTQAQVFSGSGFTIVDNAENCSLVSVTGITGGVNVASITLTNINHTYVGDLEFRVFPPANTTGVAISSPPDATPCNLAGTYRFIDSALQSIDAAAAGCSSSTVLAPGDYRTSTYGGGANPGPVTSLATTFGTLTPAQANGDWQVCITDFATGDSGTVGGTSIQLTPNAPSAAAVSVGGRVTTAGGRGIRNMSVSLTGADGSVRTTKTGAFGDYRFLDVEAGETYIIAVKGKRFSFDQPSQVLNVSEETGSVNFVGNPL